jgi:hypothetical protein
MNIQNVIKAAQNIHKSIADDVWPDGWEGNCHICGKPFKYTKEECGYYLSHGWPKCDHIVNDSEYEIWRNTMGEGREGER